MSKGAMVSPARRSWESLSPNYRRRLVAAHGGTGGPAHRAAKARAAYEAGVPLTAAQRGHEPTSVRAGRTMSAMFGDGADFRDVQSPTRGETQRLGRYNSLVGQLAEGRISPAEFRRKVESWRPIAGRRLASDPDAVLARLDERRAADRELFEYRSGRAA